MAQMFADDGSKDPKDPQTYAIIGAAMEVHSELGHGFNEIVYKDCLEIEFGIRGIPFSREFSIYVHYKGNVLESNYAADFICFGEVIVEVKALKELADTHMQQVLNYLKGTKLRRGLLLNFGAPRMEFKRVVLNY
jgi:GxxExxY protein